MCVDNISSHGSSWSRIGHLVSTFVCFYFQLKRPMFWGVCWYITKCCNRVHLFFESEYPNFLTFIVFIVNFCALDKSASQAIIQEQDGWKRRSEKAVLLYEHDKIPLKLIAGGDVSQLISHFCCWQTLLAKGRNVSCACAVVLWQITCALNTTCSLALVKR